LVVGQATQLNAVERPTATTTQDVTTTATWSSSNPGVATVSTGGLVTAVTMGTTTIKASDSTASGTLVVSVVASTVKSLLIVGPATIPVGQASQLTASISTTGSKQVVTDGVVWQSSKPDVAAVSDTGVLTGLSAGTATITASYQGVVGTLAVTVANVTVTSISFYGTTTVTRGATTQLTATATLADGSQRIVTSLAAWESLNTDIATVSSNGLVTTLSTAGTATIAATYMGVTGTVAITVN
jgi:trimeric autotransporter adhesin